MVRLKKRKYPEAIRRYRLKNPTVSAVLTVRRKEMLKSIKGSRSYGQTIEDLITDKLKPAEEYAKRLDETKKTIQIKDKIILGKNEKIKELESKINYYKVTFPCNVCGGELEIVADDKDLLDDVREYLRGKGWGHAQCNKNK